ncbi:restriction endonuclease subunit S [Enterococcus faecium]|uniref:restriction endonuclease subunit S n=2 Tax=Enterococcus TaxID=1350 RepID=UPI0004A57589|nr:restriction endonuclease subunit S [Enterococcus faecium]KEI53284.1 hypothetical protein P743_0107140 [Enterococcus faecium UC8733]PQF03537.1 restriction endonuclease subunit S [Enterococcus faecium]
MKDSGVEWIGKIPEEWEIKRVSNYFYQLKNKNQGLVEKNLLSLSYGNIVRRNIDSSDGLLPVSFDSYNIVSEGDIVLRMTDLQNDHKSLRTGFVREKGIITSAYITLRQKTDNVSSRYISLVLSSFDFMKGFYGLGNGVRQNVNFGDIRKINIPFPSIEAQCKIVSRVEGEVKRIDSIISETQQSINELKKYKQALITETVTKGLDKNVEMKDSGTPLLGKIPCNWESKKLKYCVKIDDSKQTFSEGMKYIGLEHVNSGMGDINGYSTVASNSLEKAFKKGDILYSKLRPYLAKAFIASFDGVSSGEFLVLQDFRGNKVFLKYWLISNTFTDFVNASTYGTKMPRSSWETIKEMQMPLPSQQEQDEIVKYLDIKLREVISLISNKVELISKLRDYKSSLIYEYVTGKKEA